MLDLRYFTMLCKDSEYKNIDQGESQGQLYDVQNWIKILYKQPGWAYSFHTTSSHFQVPNFLNPITAKLQSILRIDCHSITETFFTVGMVHGG